MKTKITLALLLAASGLQAGSWFAEPTYAIVLPENSKMVYHGMDGRVSYKDGQSFGLNAGRWLGDIKLYAAYSYSYGRAKNTTLETPYGAQTQPDNDSWSNHEVMLNADLYHKIYGRWKGFVGVGGGVSIDSDVSPTVEARIGVSREWRSGWTLSGAYSFRYIDGRQIISRHSDGSPSIAINEADQQRITLSVSKKF